MAFNSYNLFKIDIRVRLYLGGNFLFPNNFLKCFVERKMQYYRSKFVMR